MARFTQYPAATSPDDYTDATNFLIEDPDGNIKLASLEGLSTFFCSAQCARVTIPSAEVLTLNSIPVEIVPAQGAGTIIELISASVKIDFDSIAYATNTDLQLMSSGGTIRLAQNTSTLLATTSSSRSFEMTSGETMENTAINVTVRTGDPVSGDSDIEIFVYYRVINV